MKLVLPPSCVAMLQAGADENAILLRLRKELMLVPHIGKDRAQAVTFSLPVWISACHKIMNRPEKMLGKKLRPESVTEQVVYRKVLTDVLQKVPNGAGEQLLPMVRDAEISVTWDRAAIQGLRVALTEWDGALETSLMGDPGKVNGWE